MRLIQLVFLSMTAGATDASILFSSYCSGLLELQRPADLTVRRHITASLDVISDVAAVALKTNRPKMDPVIRAVTMRQKVTGDRVYLNSTNVLPEGPLGYDDIINLKKIPERVEQVKQDLNSIREDVAAGGIEVRGEGPVTAYLDALNSVIARNDAELKPQMPQIFPYVRFGRVLWHSVAVGLPTAGYVEAGYRIIPSFVDLDPSKGQVGATALILSATYFIAPLLYGPAWLYAKGVVSKKYRNTYERVHGQSAVQIDAARLADLRRLITTGGRQPNALIYLTRELILTESDLLELRAAIKAGRAPGASFVRNQEYNARETASTRAQPWLYKLKLDVAAYFDGSANEPVLLVIDRVERTEHLRAKKKPDAQDDSSPFEVFGGVRPVGA